MSPLYRTYDLLSVCALAFSLLLVLPTVGMTAAAADPTVDFVRDVQPILAKHCNECHGASKREGGLRLDNRAAAMLGGDSGAAFEPGKPDDSEFLLRLSSDDDDERMPQEADPLSKEDVALLTLWIEQGADWPDDGRQAFVSDHWAFQPINRPDPPRLAGVPPTTHSIDAFIHARLAQEKLRPSSAADRYTLLRRLHLDLTGLPPTLKEIDAFINDSQPGAYERLVDRLLESPHFGERWAMHWLDLARYADSDGYEKDNPRPHAYHWRDWVIDAINRDLPFDQFTVQQLAGDLLPGATDSVLLATGFHRNTLTNREGGVDQEEFRVKNVVDRTNTTMGVWMGLTVGCAQCHTHKYDPVTQREFYSLYAFFNNADERDVSVPDPQIDPSTLPAKLREHREKVAAAEAAIVADGKAFQQRRREWEVSHRPREIAWRPLNVEATVSAPEGSVRILDDGSIVIENEQDRVESVTIRAATDLAQITAVQIETIGETKKNLAADTPQNSLAIHAAPRPAGNKPGQILVSRQAQRGSATLFATGSPQAELGWRGNQLNDGSQDSATNLLNVYYRSPIESSGTLDRFRVYTKAKPGTRLQCYLLRPTGGGHYAVAHRHEFMADGKAGQREFVLPAAWKVQQGDLFAHSGNGGPTFSGDGGEDKIYYPVSKLPGMKDTINIAKLKLLGSRDYSMQAHVIPSVPASEAIEPRWTKAGATLKLVLTPASLGRCRIAVTAEPDPLGLKNSKLPAAIQAIVNVSEDQRSVAQREQLDRHFASSDPERTKLVNQLAAIKKATPKQPTVTLHTMRNGGPRQTHIHKRGNFLKKGGAVDIGTPAFLPHLQARAARPDRLDLARWLMDAQNPLTARVAVNHVWARLFGQGLVKTRDDFGTQGQPPSHPELLDWLATEYRRIDWSRKALIKLIVTSATYRQSSATRPELQEIDPENLLLARQNRFRLEAEIVRDQFLASSDLLNGRVGGRSFRPALPASVTRVQFVNKWKPDKGEITYSRGMYIHLQRNMLLPMLITFDRPDSILACARRERSNTPLQALTLLNAPRFVESARALAFRLHEGQPRNDTDRLRQAYRLTVARPPSDYELSRNAQLLHDFNKIYGADPESAAKLVGGKTPDGVPPEQFASWIAICRTLLNQDELITRE